MDFLPTLKQPRLMLFEMFYCRRIYLVVSSIFHWACGSISNVLDYKNVTWTTPNLVTVTYDFCFSLRAPNKVWLVPLMNFVNIWNQYDGDADEVLDYFEDTYIGHFRTNAPRRPHLFPMKLWNRFHRTAEELPRTNNNIEAWHNSFQANVSSIHPTFRCSTERRTQCLRRMLQNQAGHAPEPQRRRYADFNARTLWIVDDYLNQHVMDYLRHIAHNLSL